MFKFRWHHAAALTAVSASVVLGLAVVPAAGAGGVSATFSKGSDWGTGYEGKYTITNGSTSARTSWTVEFDLPAGHRLSGLWDGNQTTSGQRVTVKNTWNGTIAPGASVSFGFNVNYSGAFTAPTNCKLDGGSCSATGQPPTDPPPTDPPPTDPPPTDPPSGKINLGYFAQWTVYARNYHVKNIHTSGSAAKMTHINYAFGNVQNGQCVMGERDPDIDKFYDAASSVDGVADSWDAGALRGNFNQLRKLKKMYPHLKVLYSFGGWTWSGGFGQAAQNPAAFAESCYKFVEDPRWADVFDGIDIDWEYPNACGLTCDTSGPAAFKNIAQALRNRFGQNYLVTAAITADGTNGGKIDAADYGGAAQYLNWYNVMTYDYFGAFAAQGPTAPHSPLRSYPGIPTQGFDSDTAIQKLKSKGVPSNKLLLGIGFYGRGWTGVTQSAPGGSATGPAPSSVEPSGGIDDYKALKTRCPANGTVGGTAYAHCGNEWWSYDTPATIGGKMTYSKQQGLGGAFFWELSGDTTNGELITAIRNGLN
ncbi:glycosyl hydrolase family 18 protein [Kibdelosporangium philippinense]|uniref:chitinase n=1 Tax=Kibdelosporangium philippinense TaxID=211113 RepID=A0ABS8ZQ81_9PSEU|nr:glycosyl hydrolase family 18 protein [Kibdelosporangium philippinense]MCE7009875.1 glycosyl hydrolase family 18 protein [Kibdelosporangium philippinense]